MMSDANINNETIVALASGSLPSGVAVIRISGLQSKFLLNEFCGSVPRARFLTLKSIRHKDILLDKALVVYFTAPNSFTGEDCAEFHLHGSMALVRLFLHALCSYQGVRMAKAGEFTLRAFENSKLDLVEVEGIADLIDAETENQHKQAIARMAGGVSQKIEQWREELVFLRAEIEARIDFSDEEDVTDILPVQFIKKLQDLKQSFIQILANIEHGRIIKDGFRIAIAGRPNSGKSSLINCLANSDLAIVSVEAGTTRDIKEVPMNIDGQLVIFIDMAGLRNTLSDAEAQGIERAKVEIANADLVLWLQSSNQAYSSEDILELSNIENKIIHINSKIDIFDKPDNEDLSISTKTNIGIEELFNLIKAEFTEITSSQTIFLSRMRDKEAILQALETLQLAIDNIDTPEISADFLRQSSEALARLLGKIDPEKILGQIFSNFCIGK